MGRFYTNLKRRSSMMAATNNDLVIPVSGLVIDWRYNIVDKAQTDVKQMLADMNAADKWIAIGARLKKLKEDLAKEQAKDPTATKLRKGGDTRSENAYTGPTWEKAFGPQSRRFPFSKRTADTLIQISDFFQCAALLPIETSMPKTLPTSWYSLYELAAGFKGKEELFTKLVQTGKVTRAMTREDVKKLVHESVRGKGDNNPPSRKEKSGGKSSSDKPSKAKKGRPAGVDQKSREKDRIAAVFDYMAFVGVTADQLLAEMKSICVSDEYTEADAKRLEKRWNVKITPKHD
jgi:hypothetical protein